MNQDKLRMYSPTFHTIAEGWRPDGSGQAQTRVTIAEEDFDRLVAIGPVDKKDWTWVHKNFQRKAS
jgi:hypothetical protein